MMTPSVASDASASVASVASRVGSLSGASSPEPSRTHPSLPHVDAKIETNGHHVGPPSGRAPEIVIVRRIRYVETGRLSTEAAVLPCQRRTQLTSRGR